MLWLVCNQTIIAFMGFPIPYSPITYYNEPKIAYKISLQIK